MPVTVAPQWLDMSSTRHGRQDRRPGGNSGGALRGYWLGLVPIVLFVADVCLAQQRYQDCRECPEMVVIPPGSFEMGLSPDAEIREGAPSRGVGYSAPPHMVTIGYSFSLGRFEVTRDQFAAFVRATGHQTGSSCEILQADGTFVGNAGSGWRNPGFAQTGDDPVVCVNRADAQAYAAWLSRLTGFAYRLPSEAEWEYAARAGATSLRTWGDEREGACVHANVADTSFPDVLRGERTPTLVFGCTDGHAYAAPVGRFRANAFGLHDVLGNVWEFVADCWNETYLGAPTDGRAWTEQGNCDQQIARGGSWASYPWTLHLAFRTRTGASSRSNTRGFRIARQNSPVSALPAPHLLSLVQSAP